MSKRLLLAELQGMVQLIEKLHDDVVIPKYIVEGVAEMQYELEDAVRAIASPIRRDVAHRAFMDLLKQHDIPNPTVIDDGISTIKYRWYHLNVPLAECVLDITVPDEPYQYVSISTELNLTHAFEFISIFAKPLNDDRVIRDIGDHVKAYQSLVKEDRVIWPVSWLDTNGSGVVQMVGDDIVIYSWTKYNTDAVIFVKPSWGSIAYWIFINGVATPVHHIAFKERLIEFGYLKK